MLPSSLSSSRAGEAAAEVEAMAVAMVEMAPEEVPATTGVSPRKVRGQWAGTATVTALALDVGVSQAEPTPAAVTPGLGVEGPILQTRAPRTQAPTGVTPSQNLKPRTIARAGGSR